MLSVFTYSYDAAGNRTEVQEANADRVTWSYDDAGQLTRERRSGANAYDITYTYDEVGNRLTKVDSDATTTYSYDRANQLTAEERPAARLTYSYDANGNLELVENDEALTTYSWDIENRMVGAELPDATLNTMSYDGDGRRRTLEDSDGSRDIVWDGENVLRELDGENVIAYTHNPQQYGELISQRRSGATAFHHYDALGSTDRLTDTNEGVSASYLYKAFGEQSVLSGSHANPFTWVGRLGYYRQGDLATYWLRARTYSRLAGRFLSRDPMPNGNRYIYPGNSPLVLVDPSGRQGYRGPRGRPEPVEAPTATVARRYGPGRFHRPHPPEPPERPEPLEPQEPEEEEPVAGDGGGPVNGERLACRMRTPGEKNKKAYGYGYRWLCECPNQEHWYCSMPTGWGPPKAGRTKKGNKFVKDLWASDCRCSCPESCVGTVNMRRREWRGDSDKLVSEVERQKEVKGRCVRGPECRLEWRMGAERSNAGRLTLSKKGRKPGRFRGWAGYSGPSYSGENVACGPESQCISCLGPVPAGEHEARAWYTRASGGRAMRISDGFCAGRSGFLIHGGGEGSSRGCIVIPNIGELETQMGEKHFNCNYPVKLTVTYSIASAGDCPGSYFAKGTFSANCVKITFNLPHTCNVGCAPEVLGPASAHLAAQSPALAGAVSDGPECEGC